MPHLPRGTTSVCGQTGITLSSTARCSIRPLRGACTPLDSPVLFSLVCSSHVASRLKKQRVQRFSNALSGMMRLLLLTNPQFFAVSIGSRSCLRRCIKRLGFKPLTSMSMQAPIPIKHSYRCVFTCLCMLVYVHVSSTTDSHRYNDMILYWQDKSKVLKLKIFLGQTTFR